jgi:uncharacterized phosphosugar-binding protein
MSGAEAFFAATGAMFRRLQETQMESIRAAGRLVAESISKGGLIFTLGTGHSYYLAAEAFARAGGLWPVQVIACTNLSMLDGSARSSRTERLEGYAACILPDYEMRQGDVLIAISNSGRNAVPIEASLYARERGLKVVAATNVAHSMSVPSRHSSGNRLLDVADIVLDNCGVPGDAAVALPGMDVRVGSTSTIMGAVLIQAVMVEAVSQLQAMGLEPPVLISGNVDTPDRERRYKSLTEYGRTLKHR